MTTPGRKLVGERTLVFAWLVAVGCGMFFVLDYKSTPGAQGANASSWPGSSKIVRRAGRPTLVLAVHPRCVCTRATLSELAKLVSRSGGAFSTVVLFLRPEGTIGDWEKTDLWARAGEIVGVSRVIDDRGREAAAFGARTSGQAFLYDAKGRLRFAGGLTSARGHEGTSAGSRRILEIMHGASPDGRSAPVFGCSLGLASAPAGG